MQISKLQSKIEKFLEWIQQNKLEAVAIFSILLIAAFFRLWRIDEYMPFLGDEGRDVRVVRRFLVDFDLMFVGPRTSIGDMYLGPLYYYLIAPFLFLFRFSPVGPAFEVALLGIATVFFVWFVGREWFGKIAAFSSSFLLAISPVIIRLSKHSWNPNIMPFFALLSIYSIWRVWTKKEYKWLFILGISYAFVLQSHYLGLLLFPTLVLFWFFSLLHSDENGLRRKFLVSSFLSFFVFLFLMSPLFLFDVKHGWHNAYAMQKFFTERQTTVSAKPWNAIQTFWPIWDEKVITRLVLPGDENVGKVVAVATLIGYLLLLVKYRGKYNPSLVLLSSWLGFGMLGLSLYRQSIFDHYFGFMFAGIFLLIGVLFQEIWKTKFRFLVPVSLAILALINLSQNPLKDPPQRQMQRTIEVDKKILEESGSKPFNLALIAKQNYEEGYLYFFELWKSPVKEIDPQRYQETKTDQLFVVCEDNGCDPVHSSKAEVTNFGWSKIDKTWEVDGLRLYRLVQNPEGKPQ